MITYSDKTLATIVTQSHQAAVVFEKFNLDFCCKGKRTLYQACTEQQLSLDTVETELNEAINNTGSIKDHLFTEMTLTQLIGYIILKHHFYVKQAMPLIYSHLEKVAIKHGDRYPYMREVYYKFSELKMDMDNHMKKEEEVLFPRIQYLDKLSPVERLSIEVLPASIGGPVKVMEAEHDLAGTIMDNIRVLTNNYLAPESACTTFKLCLAELKEFEEDLHRHVHLENHLLFPRAIEMCLIN